MTMCRSFSSFSRGLSSYESRFSFSQPDQRQSIEARHRKSRLKRLGDPPILPASQNFGTYVRERSTRDIEVFIKLARGYVFEGINRKTICTSNAEVKPSNC